MIAASGYFAEAKDASQCGVRIMAGLELGFPVFASMNGIQIVKGKPTMSANFMAAAIKKSGKYNYRVLSHTDSGCKIEFYERSFINGKFEVCGVSEFGVKEATAAGLISSEIYKKYAKNMFFARAISNGVRWYCPDIFLGNVVYTAEELGSQDVEAVQEVVEIVEEGIG
jgi:hypothetical protein